MTRTQRLLLAMLAVTTLLTGCEKLKSLFTDQEQPATNVAIPAQPDGQVAMLLPDFTQLVERDGKAVVNIQAIRDNNASPRLPANDEGQSPFPENDPFFDFFRRFMPDQQTEPETESISFGSGFIISQDGYILTNSHVVANGGNITVKLTDKREFQAKLIGLDKRSDVAVLKIDATNLPVVKIGSPAQLKVGEWVAAIGAPFGFDNTVTAGIVSAKGRSLPDESYVPFIQTDVAINPGNSGGPLFNLKGQVVGINSQIYSRSGGFMGISFAIPIDIAMGVAEQIKKTGTVRRGQMGVYIQTVTQDLATSFKLDRPRGALVVRVTPNGPGAKGGLEVGDIILTMNGKPVENSQDLPMMTGALEPGQKVELGVWRKGSETTVTIVLGELAGDTDNTRPQQPQQEQQPQNHQLGKLGLSLAELSENQKKELGIPGGLVVMRATGAAAQAGLMRGDILIGINQQDISDFKSFEQAISGAKGNTALLVKRGENTLFLAIKIN